MPLEPVAVYKDGAGLWNGIVVVDKEGKVGDGLVATIGRYAKIFYGRIYRRVDVVDAEMVLGRKSLQPSSVAVGSNV